MIWLLLPQPASAADTTYHGWYGFLQNGAIYEWEAGSEPDILQKVEIQFGMSAWEGGAGFPQETFDFQFCLLGDPCDSSGFSEVSIWWHLTRADFKFKCPDFEFGCVKEEYDVSGLEVNYLNVHFDGSQTFGTGFPEDSPSPPSLGWVAAHEFGHVMGLAHYDVVPALMNSKAARGGDANHHYRVNADDYIPMRDQYPGGGVLPNLMVYGFRRTGLGQTAEVWQDSASIGWLEMAAGECLQGSDCCTYDNHHPYVALNGLSTVDDVVVEWYLTTSDDPAECSEGTLIARELGDLVPGVPRKLNFNFRNEAVGEFDNGVPLYADESLFYHLCVVVDPDDLIVESSETDNFFTSDFDLLDVAPTGHYCS